MAKKPDPTEDEGDEHDSSFLDYLTRNFLKCKTLTDFIEEKVAEAMEAANPQPEASPPGNYLEKQNAMLMAKLLKLDQDQSALTQPPPGPQPGAPPRQPRQKPDGPPVEPLVEPKTAKAFWR